MENLLLSFTSVMQNILYILLAVVVLLVMITVHEFGHYTAGRIFHFKINEFAIGFGPKLFSRTAKNGEIFSVRALPLGGFCAFAGEDEEDASPDSFNNKKPWQRIIVLISGALMNYLLAVLLIVLMFAVYGQPAYRIHELSDPTAAVGEMLRVDDVILNINGRRIYMATDIMKSIDELSAGDVIPVTVLREGEKLELLVTLKSDGDFVNIEDTNTLLKALGCKSLYAVNVRTGFWSVLGGSFEYSFRVAGTIFTVLGQLLTGKLGLSSLGGTITTVTVTANAIKTGGLNYLLMISSFIGVNLAVFNLLPIPALDGSRVIFTLIEWIRKKPVNRKVEGAIHFAGLIFLVGFAVLVDVLQLF